MRGLYNVGMKMQGEQERKTVKNCLHTHESECVIYDVSIEIFNNFFSIYLPFCFGYPESRNDGFGLCGCCQGN